MRLLKIYLMLFILGACSFALGSEKEAIKLAAFEYPPFYYEQNGNIRGIAVELLEELCKRMDVNFKLKIYPLKRALGYLKDGNIDAILVLIKTTEREKYLAYTEPFITVRGLIWSAADRKDVKVDFEQLEDLKPYKIGATLGYSYGQKLDDLLKTMNVDYAKRDYNNYKKLMSHRIDIFPGNEIVAKGLFKIYPEFKNKFVASDKSFVEWILRMGVSKKSKFVFQIPKINAIFADLKKEGLIDKIVEKYTE